MVTLVVNCFSIYIAGGWDDNGDGSLSVSTTLLFLLCDLTFVTHTHHTLLHAHTLSHLIPIFRVLPCSTDWIPTHGYILVPWFCRYAVLLHLQHLRMCLPSVVSIRVACAIPVLCITVLASGSWVPALPAILFIGAVPLRVVAKSFCALACSPSTDGSLPDGGRRAGLQERQATARLLLRHFSPPHLLHPHTPCTSPPATQPLLRTRWWRQPLCHAGAANDGERQAWRRLGRNAGISAIAHISPT